LNEYSISWILNHIDCFVSQSRGNKSVTRVRLFPYASNGQNDEVWDKVGQAIGNLQSLENLEMCCHDNYDDMGNESDYPEEEDDDEVVLIHDWKILERILRHVRQSVTVNINDSRLRTLEEVQPLARAIRGHPTITSFVDRGMFPYESLDTFYSALATLPALESITLAASEVRQADESILVHPGSLTELLRVPTLRAVRFEHFSFTPALFRATSYALMDGTAITYLAFEHCSFSAGEYAAIMAAGLSRNTSVVSISVVHCNNAQALFDTLAAALPSNSTLRYLEVLGRQDGSVPDCLSPIFSALGKIRGSKRLR
jgi:hypothetical protein